MGTLADSGLVAQGKDGIWAYDEDAVDGASFEVVIDNVTDASGDPLDYVGLTSLCFASGKIGGITVVEFDTAWSTVDGLTRLTISKNDEDMIGLAGGQRTRPCVWSLSLSDDTDTVFVWAAHDSNLYIHGRG